MPDITEVLDDREGIEVVYGGIAVVDSDEEVVGVVWREGVNARGQCCG